MKKILWITGLLMMLVPVFSIHAESERWEHILTTDFFIYSFDKLSLKTRTMEAAGGEALDVWLKYQYREPAIAEMLAWAKRRNMPEEDIKDTENLDFLLVHTLFSKGAGKLELETIAYYKNGLPLKLAPAAEDWRAIIPGSVNEYLFARILAYASGQMLLDKGIFNPLKLEATRLL